MLSCYTMQCPVMSCHVMSCHVMSCYVMLCYVMLCPAIFSCCCYLWPSLLYYPCFDTYLHTHTHSNSLSLILLNTTHTHTHTLTHCLLFISQCLMCGSAGGAAYMLFCVDCGEAFHSYCADLPLSTMTPAFRLTWRCTNCKLCEICGVATEDHGNCLVYCGK